LKLEAYNIKEFITTIPNYRNHKNQEIMSIKKIMVQTNELNRGKNE